MLVASQYIIIKHRNIVYTYNCDKEESINICKYERKIKQNNNAYELNMWSGEEKNQKKYCIILRFNQNI